MFGTQLSWSIKGPNGSQIIPAGPSNYHNLPYTWDKKSGVNYFTLPYFPDCILHLCKCARTHSQKLFMIRSWFSECRIRCGRIHRIRKIGWRRRRSRNGRFPHRWCYEYGYWWLIVVKFFDIRCCCCCCSVVVHMHTSQRVQRMYQRAALRVLEPKGAAHWDDQVLEHLRRGR